MDNNSWRPDLPNGDPSVDTGDWRSQLPPDSRQKIVNKIMETLKKHLPLSATEGVNELRRIAARFEEKIFSGAVNQSDYLRKISMKMLTMDSKSQNATGSSSSIPAANNVSSMDIKPNIQGHLLPGALPNNQSQAPPQPSLSQPMQSNTASGMTGSTALTNNTNVTSVVNQNPTSLDSTAQTESANGVDWQEEVYQKIQTMKEAYLPDLSEINQRVGAKLQQDASLPQQQRSEQFEKLKQFKNMLDRMIQFLSVPKINIMPALKDKVANYEKQIINFLNNHRPRRPIQQGQMQQQSAQNGQDQSHDSQANTQMQSMSMAGSVPRAQQSSLANMQNNVLSSRPGVSAPQQSIPASSLESGQGNAQVKSISPQSLSSGVSDIRSVVSMVDRIAGSAPGNGSRTSVGEDLVAMTKCRLQARNLMTQEGMPANKKMKRHTTAMPLSVGDNYNQFACSETSDLESTATSVGKKARTETEHALLEEIKEINQRLIDTVVEISNDEDAADASEGATASKGCEGTTVRFSFKAVSLSPALKAHLSSTQMSPIQPLRLLVPCSYPRGSPSLLDNLPVETSKEKEDLSSKAMARFNILLRSLSQPMSLKDIAKTWEACARTVICEYAQQFGGGTFSSKYGTWEKFVAAS
uniref:Mediator complex subunit 15 KIX domain-containing protein n=1 Tax=Brassica oleracea var. oleracea TaxID=109376 RepID=A0A0D3DX39_BRAOL